MEVDKLLLGPTGAEKVQAISALRVAIKGERDDPADDHRAHCANTLSNLCPEKPIRRVHEVPLQAIATTL